MKNYYSILGVSIDADDAEIKTAYRTLARKYHPDINHDGGQKFKDILEAYETLSKLKKLILRLKKHSRNIQKRKPPKKKKHPKKSKNPNKKPNRQKQKKRLKKRIFQKSLIIFLRI